MGLFCDALVFIVLFDSSCFVSFVFSPLLYFFLADPFFSGGLCQVCCCGVDDSEESWVDHDETKEDDDEGCDEGYEVTEFS